MKGISKTKKALKSEESQRCEDAARELGGEYYKIWKVLRYSGCHPRVVMPYDYFDKKSPFKEYGMKEEINEAGLVILQWNRPKKRGAKAYTSVPKLEQIDFIVEDWMREIRARKSHYKQSVRYAQDLLKVIGAKAGVEGLSPLSLRHTLCVDLALSGLRESVICDTYNITPSVLKTYVRMRDTQRDSIVLNALNGLYGKKTMP